MSGFLADHVWLWEPLSRWRSDRNFWQRSFACLRIPVPHTNQFWMFRNDSATELSLSTESRKFAEIGFIKLMPDARTALRLQRLVAHQSHALGS